jgi:hypothetical protein
MPEDAGPAATTASTRAAAHYHAHVPELLG